MSTPDTFTELLREELTPAPDPDFAAEMDDWAAAGFPHRDDRDREAGRRPSTAGWLDRAARALRSPFGTAATGTAVAVAIVALLIAVSPDQATQDQGSSAGGGGGGGVAESAPQLRGGGSDAGDSVTASPAPAPAGGIAPGQRDRKIERAAQLTLGAPADEFQSVADRIVQTTDRHNGFVLRSQLSTGDSPSGDFQLRIPAGELQAALRDLSALADVRARSDSGQDVTREYLSVTDSLQAARAERRALLRRLATAVDDGRMQRLRDRLDANARELNGLRAQVRDLRERTNYASVSVSLVEGNGDSGGAGGTSKALDDSLGLLLGSFNWLLRALGVLIPVGVVGGAAWAAARTIRRRRREAVLF
jgi:hypothetical protein